MHDDMPLVGGERLNLVLYVVRAAGAVEELDEVGIDGVELEDVVVHKHERLAYGGAVGQGGVGEHGNLAAGGVLVAQADRGAHCLGKRGCRHGLAVAGERDDVGQHAGLAHLAQLGLKGSLELLGAHAALVGAALRVEAVLAVQAVERADLARRRHEVDAQRHSQATAVDGPVDGAWVQLRRHDGFLSLRDARLTRAAACMVAHARPRGPHVV